MKNILFLILICVIKLSAYEYLIEDLYNIPNYHYKISFVNDVNGYQGCIKKYDYSTGEISYTQTNNIITNFGQIKFPINQYYVKKSVFDSWLKSDLRFLNDLYTTNDYFRNGILNYLYNESEFVQSNYIDYLDYEILYNEDGLAVESIVGGVWAGLYDDSQKSKSGAMYNKNGSLIYYNGKEVTPLESFLNWLQRFTTKVVLETFEEIHRTLVAWIIVAVVLVLAIVRFVLELLPSSISSRRRRYYGGGRGSLPYYGDGSQVAASVRARLAAKNKALKERSNGGFAVQQSNINGILFDLENER